MRARSSDESIAQAITAIQQLADENARAIYALASDVESMRREVQAEVRRREEAERRARDELAAARSALDDCRRNPEADCSGPAQHVDRCSMAADDAAQSLSAARGALSSFESAARDFEIRASVHRSQMQRSRELASNARALIEDLSSYGTHFSAGTSSVSGVLASAGGSGGSGGFGGSSGSGGGGGSADAPAPAPIGNTGAQLVSLDSIDDSDSTVGAGSFNHHIDYQSAEWANETVESTILPAARRGHGREYFAQRDRDEGRGPDRSLARLYDTTFGTNAVSLSRNADGSFSVNGGYHRIWMARERGSRAIPARIV